MLEHDRQRQQKYYRGASQSNDSGASSVTISLKHAKPNKLGRDSRNMSQYMKNKISKNREQVVERKYCGSGDYTDAIPSQQQRRRNITPPRIPRSPPKHAAGLQRSVPNRSLLDDVTETPTSYSRKVPVGEGISRCSADHTSGSSNHSSYGDMSSLGANISAPLKSATSEMSSQLQNDTSASSDQSFELCLPLPYSKLPNAKPIYGRTRELEALKQMLEEGGSLTSLVGGGGIGKTHLAIHACKKWLAQRPFSRFVVWLNAATEWTLRISYLEALQQVLMGNLQVKDDASTSEQGEIIIVAELLQRQLQRQRRKEAAQQLREEQRRKRKEADVRNETAQVFSEDSEDFADEEDTAEDDSEPEEVVMNTNTLAHLLWDALLQGISQEYEWVVVVQNLPGGMGGVQGPAGFQKFFFPTKITSHDEWSQGRILFTTRHESFSGTTPIGYIRRLQVDRLEESAAVDMLIANTVFSADTEIGCENLASPDKEKILRDSERIGQKLVGLHYLDGSPLMIATAIGQIASTGVSLRQYYTHLKQQVAIALETSGYGNGNVQTSVKRETAMSVCLELAMDNAHAQGLADILSAAAFVSAENIPFKLLGGDTESVEKLCMMNLLLRTGEETYSMHRVHQRTARDAIITSVTGGVDGASEEELEDFLCTPEQATLAMRAVLANFQAESCSTWRDARGCIPHMEALRVHHDILHRKNQLPANFNHGFYAEIIDSSASVLHWAMKDRDAAFAMFKESLRLQRKIFRDAPTAEFMSANSGYNMNVDLASAMAKTLTCLGGLAPDDAGAHYYYKEAIVMYFQAFGEDAKTIELMTLLIAIADVESKLQQYDTAYSNYKKALELYFTIYGHNQNIYADDQKMFLAETLQKIGDLAHRQLEKHAEAELYLQGTVSLLRHVYDDGSDAKNDEMAAAFETLGSICHAQEKMKDASLYYKNALKMKSKIHGDKKWTEISNKYGALSKDSLLEEEESAKNGDDQSEDSYSDGDDKAGIKLTESKGKPLLVHTLHNNSDQEQFGVELIPVDVESRKRAASQKDAKMAGTLHKLGVMAWNLGSLKQAEDYFQKALTTQYKAYGDDAKNEDIAITLFSLGGLATDLHNDQEKACDYYRRALECYYLAYGDDAQNESIAQLLHALGQSSHILKKYQEARTCLKKVRTLSLCIYRQHHFRVTGRLTTSTTLPPLFMRHRP
jgi:tetratricopeptide (TPR) repeat protein